MASRKKPAPASATVLPLSAEQTILTQDLPPVAVKQEGRLFIATKFDGPDQADGGIRRVVEAQTKWLPKFGWELVESIEAADVVVGHAINSYLMNNSVASVLHCHGLYWSEYDWMGDWYKQVNAKVIESCLNADAVVAVSEWVAQVLRHGFMRPIYVLGNGVDLEDWPLPELGSVGSYVLWNKTRTDAACDPQPVLELARRAPTAEIRTTFRQVAQLPSNINNVGIQPYQDHKEHIRHAGVYLATTRETFGIGTLEAMASGVPVLGWAWGGQRDIVEHGVTGWLCRPGDYDGLLEGLEYCLANRETLGRAARAAVSGKYTWERVIGQYAALYAQVLAERRGHQGRTVTSQPRVSVIITNYKLERYLERAIQSCTILGPNVEVLVVDDCSPGDGSGQTSAEIVASLGQSGPDVGLVRTPTNLYTAGALNYGIARATGSIIMCLDADNELGQAAPSLVEALENDRTIDIAYGAVEFHPMRGVGLDEEETGEVFLSDWPREFDYSQQMVGQNQVPSTCAFRRSLWVNVGGYRERFKAVEDADFWTRLSSYGARPKKVTNGTTLLYRDRPTSSSHVQDRSFRWIPWYPWNGVNGSKRLTPLGAAVPASQRINLTIPTHEPVQVSVIIAVGPGHAKYVVDAIDSVIAQSFDKWELIVVNDSGEKLVEDGGSLWIPPFAKYAVTPAIGSGPATARNIGLDMATGRAFVFLDADDFFEPDALAAMWQVWDRPVSVGGQGFVYGDFVRVGGEQHGTVYKCPEWPELLRQVLRLSPIPVTFMGPMAAGIRFDENLPAWEDWDFIYQLLNVGVAGSEGGYCGTHIDRPILNYRLETGMRREANFEGRHEFIQAIHEKWADYREGRKELMSCRGCGGGGGQQAPGFQQMGSVGGVGAGSAAGTRPGVASTTDDMVLVDFLEKVGGQRSYTGPITSQTYRFGDDPGHRTRWVDRRDAKQFVDLRPGTFAYHDENMVDGGALANGRRDPGPMAPPTPELVSR